MNELKPNDKRAKAAVIIMYVMLAVSAVSGGYSIYTNIFYTNIINGHYYSDQTVGLVAVGEGLIGMAKFSANIVCIVLFILWFRRGYANIDRAGVLKTESNDNMAFWSFVIPILNLFKPYQMVKEIWEKTQQSVRSIQENYEMSQGSFFILGWWLWFVVSRIVDQFIFRMSLKLETPEQFAESSMIDIFANLFDILGCMLTVFMIKKISSKEADLWKAIEHKKEQDNPVQTPFTGNQTEAP